MLLQNALNPQQEIKDCYFFCLCSINRALYHLQAEELVPASDSCSSTVISSRETTEASTIKFVFTLTFIVCSPICPDNCGAVFLWKYILVFEKWLFSFDRSNMQIFTVNITRVVWPRVMNLLYLRYFCQHNPLFYPQKLILYHCWSWQRNIYFLVNNFVRHTFTCRKVAQNKDSFNNDRHNRIYWASSF